MLTHFSASESLEMTVDEKETSIHHYLRQPQRIVKSIADPKLMKQLGSDRYELKMRPISFMELYKLQPIVVLKVWSGSSGTIYLNSESCQVKGIEYINERFSLKVKGKLTPYQHNEQTYLRGKADLEVKVELPPALWLTPKPILEMAGNSLLKGVLQRIKQRLMSQLISDYYHWIGADSLTTERHQAKQLSPMITRCAD
jgi:hypothetical protein